MYCLIFLIDAIKPIIEKKLKNCFIFTRLFRGGEFGAYKIKPVSFNFAFGLLAATQTLFKRNEKIINNFPQSLRNDR